MTRGGRLPLVRPEDEITAEGENEVRKAVNGLLGMGVDSTMSLSWLGGTPFLSAFAGLRLGFFYTTSSLSSPTVSATGTALASFSDAMTSCTARRCKVSTSGTITADTSASDDTIWLWQVVSSTVATGSLALCAEVGGFWVVVDLARCAGS